MKRLLILIALLGSAASATTWTASSCTATAFNTAMASAATGDTVRGPGGGPVAWGGTLTVTKDIIIDGNGCSITLGTNLFVNTNVPSSVYLRITNFSTSGGGDNLIILEGAGSRFRLDHLTFSNPSGRVIRVGYNTWYKTPSTALTGLIDHITFSQNAFQAFGLCFGDDKSWTMADDFGSANAIYIEDSSFTWSVVWNANNDVWDGEHGCRYVVRHNTITQGAVLGHDTGSTAQSRGQRTYEIYANTWLCNGGCSNEPVSFRGGTGVVYDNTMPIYGGTTNGFDTPSFSEIWRLTDSSGVSAPWTYKVNASPNPICNDFRSHCSAGDNRACGAFENPGSACTNGGSGTCTNNPTTDAGCGAGVVRLANIDGGGSGGYPVRDQVARGQDAADHITQALDPVYIWHNLDSNNGNALITSFMTVAGGDAGYINANRDYYQQGSSFSGATGVGRGTLTSRPSTCTTGVAYWETDNLRLDKCTSTNTWTNAVYTPYTYPHPLQATTTVPVVTTTTVIPASISAFSATSGGTVLSNGGASVTSEGVCYAITANPTMPCTSDGTATPFTSLLVSLTPSTLYHYRAFATNSVGTGYGSDLTFTTLSPPPPPGIAKFQGRVKIQAAKGGVGISQQTAQLPQQWVHNYITPDTQANPICDFSGGFTEDDVTLSTISVAGLQAQINLWQGGNRRIKIPAGSLINGATYTNFQGTSPTSIAYAQNALIVMSPTTGNAPNVIANPTGCLLIESDTPPTRYQTICANVPPDNTRPRNPNCTGDVANLWTIRQDHSSSNDTSYAAIYFPPGANHIIVRDGEFTILPGDAQSTTGAHGRSPILADVESHDLGLEYVWVHGWNPGDAAGASPRTWTGQPTSNAALNSDGSCKNWNHTGTVSTNGTQVIWRSGDRFGGDFSDGVNLYGHTYVDAQAKIYIGGTAGVWHSGTQYTIASGGHDPTDMSLMTCSDGGGPGTGTMTCGDKVLTLSTSAGVQTDVVYNMSNPFAAMVPGCGDDLSNGVTWYANNSWIMWSQINKMHYWQTEGHSLLVGFQNGPLKIAHNWLEAGAGGLFFGGGAVDVSRQGPVKNVEIRNNYIGNDLWEKYLSAAQAHSPGPPWGCGPLDESETGAASHDTCTFQHSKKNPLELKFCINCLLDANDVEGSWTDGQNGLVGAWPNRNCSGGTLCGIFDSAGLPRVGIKHQTITNNLFHDGGQGIALGARCGGPGNGGGLCFPSSYEDVKNNVFFNIDAKEFGDQAGNFSNMLMNIGDTGQTYLCTMSRTNGTAHAHCANGSFTGPSSNVSIVRIVRTGTPGQKNGVVTIEYGNRKDLLIGGTVTLAVTGTGASNFNGTFTITGVENNINSTHSTTACDNNATPWVNATNQPCIGNTGRYSDTLVYTDTVNTQVASTDTLCASGTGTTCSTGVLGTDALSAMSLAYSATDIMPGQDPVLIYTGNYDPDGNANHGAGVGCSDNNAAGYATSGLATLPLAALPGSAAGLDVYYAQSTLPDESSGVQCFLDNGAGQGNHLTIANNTIVSGDALAINNNALTSQERYTTIANNVYVAPDNSTGGGGCAGKRSFLTVPSSASTCEGTASLASFDQSTFKFYGNVIGLARTPSNWCTSPTGITCPAIGSSLVNSFPAAFADIGFATTQAQQSRGCDKTLAPFNCPLMSLPWADNLKLSDLVISGTYAGKGADISAITTARASTKYTCATPCGSAGPYKDAP